MIDRRTIVAAAAVLPALSIAGPAFACRAAGAKDQAAYRQAVDRLFAAWWRRDLPAFRDAFEHEDVERPFDPTRMFGQHFTNRDERPFKRNILISGTIAVVEVLVPRPADPERGICGGMARAELFAVQFFPGLQQAVVERLTPVGSSILAQTEWRTRNG